MVKCENCGKEVFLPYKCNYCGGLFCEDCRLPSHHNCKGINVWKGREPPSKAPKKAPIKVKTSKFSSRKREEKYRPYKPPRNYGKIIVPSIVAISLILGIYFYGGDFSSIFSKEEENIPKEPHLDRYPEVLVSYKVEITGPYVHLYKLFVTFNNTGDELVDFLITGIAIVDENGKTFRPTAFAPEVRVYPKSITSKDFTFFEAIPKSGTLHVAIMYEDKKEEVVSLPFSR